MGSLPRSPIRPNSTSSSPTRPLPSASHSEKEPGDRLEDAVEIPVPSIVEGVIQHPGDSDLFKFKVHSGQKLAFEVETPEVTRPDFNPLLQVIDSRGRDQFSSLRPNRKVPERHQCSPGLRWIPR